MQSKIILFLFLLTPSSTISHSIVERHNPEVLVTDSNTNEVDTSSRHHSSLRGHGNGDGSDNGNINSEKQGIIRKLSFWDAVGDVFTGCPAGDVGDSCSAVCTCLHPHSCEAWYHVCRAPGRVNDPCHLTRPCGYGLSCEAGTQICRAPGNVNDPCHLTRPCKSHLTCEAGSQICRAPGKHGDPCHLTRPCASGYFCVDSVSAWNYQMCLPDCTNYSSNVESKLINDGYSPANFPGFDEKWVDGVVPFQADCELENNESALFAHAMKHIEENTNIRFVRYNPRRHDNYIILTDLQDSAASSWVGRMKSNGWQRVNLDTDRFNRGHDLGSAIHELVHVLGWKHTQSRPDRDNYVTIITENILSDFEHNFDASRSNVYDAVQRCRDYDYDSIMHYSSSAFSNNHGELTIVTKDSRKQDTIGQRDGLSEQDIIEINEYYFGSPDCAR